jgi:hypothetical protein
MKKHGILPEKKMKRHEILLKKNVKILKRHISFKHFHYSHVAEFYHMI